MLYSINAPHVWYMNVQMQNIQLSHCCTCALLSEIHVHVSVFERVIWPLVLHKSNAFKTTEVPEDFLIGCFQHVRNQNQGH